MKNLKYIMLALVLTAFMAGAVNAATDDSRDPKPPSIKIKSLNFQIRNEITGQMMLPVYLKYSDKNLKGTAIVLMNVSDNGKISVEKISGLNKQLNGYIRSKIESLNLWTNPLYGNSQFTYRIVMS